MKKTIVLLIFIFLLGTFLNSCTNNKELDLYTPTNDTGNNLNSSSTAGSYPVPNSSYPVPNSSYPVPNSSYPVPENTNQGNIKYGPDFNMEEPVKWDSLIVKGYGPAEVPLVLVDVSNMGERISQTVINKEGIFVFDLNEPLIKGHSIGIQLGDLTGTNFDPNDFIYSLTYYDKPMIGILFDIVLVE